MAAPSHAMKINGVCKVFWTTKMVHLCPLMFLCTSYSAIFVLEDLCEKLQISIDPILYFFFFVWKRAAKTLLNKMYLCVMEESKSHRIGMTCRQINDPRIRIFGYITSSKPFIVHFLWDFGSLKSRTFFSCSFLQRLGLSLLWPIYELNPKVRHHLKIKNNNNK